MSLLLARQCQQWSSQSQVVDEVSVENEIVTIIISVMTTTSLRPLLGLGPQQQTIHQRRR